MKTILWNAKNFTHIQEAANCLIRGEVVAFPTETVYGLGANALDEQAVKKIYGAKGRPSDNPLIVHICSLEMLEILVTAIPLSAQKLINSFWPGALTIIFKKKNLISNIITAGLDTVAVRMPVHPVAFELIKTANLPIAAPSANLSGKPSPTQAKHVFADMNGKIAGILDGGNASIGLESTVIDCTVTPAIILRPGGITKEAIEKIIDVQSFCANDKMHNSEQPKSPGMKYRHYAPQAEFIILAHNLCLLQSEITRAQKNGKKIGVMVTDDFIDSISADVLISLGNRNNLETAASRIFDALREFDNHNVAIIFTTQIPKNGLGDAIMNRLEKACSKK